MSDLVIEDGVPIPSSYGHRGGRSPLREAVESLEVGQSIFLPISEGFDIVKTKGKLSNAAAATRLGKQNRLFTVRTAEKDGVLGGRLWRTK